MKLIINIPDEAYELLKNKSKLDNIAESIIANGTPISTEGDLISRTKLLISVLAMIGHNNEIVTQDKVLGWAQGVDNCRELIENAPTVELNDKSLEIARKSIELGRNVGKLEGKLERPQGKWIEGFHEHFETLDCSCCGYVREERHLTLNFCPNCGADMRNPNCVRCDHFGKCEGCEKGEEE